MLKQYHDQMQQHPHQHPQQTHQRGKRKKSSTTLLLSSARFVSAIARLSLGPLLPLLTLSFHFSDRDTPALLSAFSSGYILTQVAGGYFADRFGYRSVISTSLGVSALLVFWLTLNTTGHGEDAATVSIASMWTKVYFVLGLVSGPLFPAGSTAITLEVPRENRATAAAVVDAAAAAGTTVAAMTPLLATVLGGWRLIFQFTAGGLCLISMMFWQSNDDDGSSGGGGDRQQQHRSSTRKTHPADHDNHDSKKVDGPPQRQSDTSASALSPSPLSSQRKTTTSFWNLVRALLQPVAIGTYLCHGCDNFTKYSLSSWSATMLVQRHEVSPSMVGILLGSQEAVGFFSRILLSVYMSGKGYAKSKHALRNYRAAVSTVTFLVQAAAMKYAMGTQSTMLWQTVAGFIVAAMASGGHSIGYRPFYLEMNDHFAGSISGFGNTLASMASIVGPVMLGMAVARSDDTAGDSSGTGEMNGGGKEWNAVGSMLSAVNLFGASVSAILLLSRNGVPSSFSAATSSAATKR
eukprot:CAMPEP_0119555424 /NCGR_PEP_ID=MMETSP1352-20130426/7640_1 /TAXON_ID=265584 /ORGANISM="Stauroneis constricta, Strain CCMP1120" /LENGTH=519 /DNA_ID=CAMNT_0007602183 /DNA_START=206 /DNA_END=1765 /DNA_ORIENTATION=-